MLLLTQRENIVKEDIIKAKNIDEKEKILKVYKKVFNDDFYEVADFDRKEENKYIVPRNLSNIPTEKKGYFYDSSRKPEDVGFNTSKLSMALLIYATSKHGMKQLEKIREFHLRTTKYCYEKEENQLYFIYEKANSQAFFQAIVFIGEGRFNKSLGYMPGALIFAHEVGHTQFGGYRFDHHNDSINHKLGSLKDTSSNPLKEGVYYNIEMNENPMRKAFGMDERRGYTTKTDCYNKFGIEEQCTDEVGNPVQPYYFKEKYQLSDSSFMTPTIKIK